MTQFFLEVDVDSKSEITEATVPTGPLTMDKTSLPIQFDSDVCGKMLHVSMIIYARLTSYHLIKYTSFNHLKQHVDKTSAN